MRRGVLIRSLLFAVFASSAFLLAQNASLCAAQSHPDPLHDMFDVRTFKQVSISPDGKRVAWVENLPSPGGAPSSNSAIYVADVNPPSRAIRITAAASRAAHQEDNVAWSPDSKRLAFLSDAGAPHQLQLFVTDLTRPSAEPKQLTRFRGFLSHPHWSPDGKTIALLYIENAERAAGPLVAETPDVGVISQTYTEQRLTLVDPATGNARQITPPDMYAYEFDWAPDSARLVLTAAHGNGDDNWWVADMYSVDAASGAMREILANPGLQMADPRWSPDGRQIAFIGGLMSDQGVTGGEVFTIPAEGGKPLDVTSGMTQSASSLHWAPDSRAILFVGIAGGETAISRVGVRDGKISRVWRGDERISSGVFAPNISLARSAAVSAVILQSFSQPPEICIGPIGQWNQVTNANAGLRPAWGKAVSLNWNTTIGDVQGWLIYPANFDPQRKYPMVVVVHGGPASATLPGWPRRGSYYMALPAQGYFLLLPNPRGSYGEGENFTRANVKDFGYGDWRDVLAGVDKAIQSAPIDPKRLGLTGWSYGGYMTMWGVTQTSRFRAAVAGAGVSDWLSYYGENKIDQWMIPYFGASVYDDPAVYARSAPITYIKQASTPTLVVVGQYDGECPAPQSLEFWHALETLHVPTRLVIYPNEGHGFVNPAHNRDVVERTIHWFNKYLQPAD
jgi:dipeptidyl aminopeptidase/acylaminoacyl peptidase